MWLAVHVRATKRVCEVLVTEDNPNPNDYHWNCLDYLHVEASNSVSTHMDQSKKARVYLLLCGFVCVKPS